MNCDELDITSVEHDPKDRKCYILNLFFMSSIEKRFLNIHVISANPIVIENGHFTWGDQDAEQILKNINLHVPRGSLVAVVGAVGSGKSSLLAALLGEMNKVSGRIHTYGTCHLQQNLYLL